jgi:hypothetical protein
MDLDLTRIRARARNTGQIQIQIRLTKPHGKYAAILRLTVISAIVFAQVRLTLEPGSALDS